MFNGFDKLRFAEDLFEQRDYRTAARHLAELVADESEGLHRSTAARLLLARAYYHSAQLKGAEAAARAVIEADPTDAYAHLLLGRTLQRGNRDAEAVPHLALAAAMGLAA